VKVAFLAIVCLHALKQMLLKTTTFAHEKATQQEYFPFEKTQDKKTGFQ
jgi:hypothetical protein